MALYSFCTFYSELEFARRNRATNEARGEAWLSSQFNHVLALLLGTPAKAGAWRQRPWQRGHPRGVRGA